MPAAAPPNAPNAPNAPATPARRVLIARSLTVAGALAGLGLLPATAQAAYAVVAFQARTVAEVWRALGVSAPVHSPELTLAAPDVAENGSSVSLACACSAPGVRRLALLIEQNPSLLAALFDVTEAMDPALATRVKMAQSSTVLAVAVLADGRVLFTQRDVAITQGGCGG